MFSIFVVPAYHLVAGLTGILTPLLGGPAAVAAIIGFTMAVRILLTPLSLRALRGQAGTARLAPELLALRQRYASQPERLQREIAALYRREGTSMFAGLTPALLQWPFVSMLYLLFRSARIAGKPNTLLSHDLLGVPLGAHWLGGAGPASLQGAVFLGVFALLAALCWLSARQARLMAASVAAPSRKAAPGVAAPAEREPRKVVPTDGTATTGRTGVLVRVLPYLTIVIAALAPLAAAVYLVTSTAWSLAERWFFMRRGPGAGGPGVSRGPACGRGAGGRAGRGPRS